MQLEIGSNFYADRRTIGASESVTARFAGNATETAWLSSGRGAIAFLLRFLESRGTRKRALLPAYTCDTVVDPFIRAGWDVGFYNVDERLLPVDIMERAAAFFPNLLLAHAYYGFDTLSGVRDGVSVLRDGGCAVVEDLTQSLFSEFARLDADYYVSSIRKWFAVPDGGFAAAATGSPFEGAPSKEDAALTEAKLRAFDAKNRYMESPEPGLKEEFLELYRYAESVLDGETELFAISSASRDALNRLDVCGLIRARRENFKCLLENTDGLPFLRPVFGNIPPEAVPLYFPVYLKSPDDRAALQKKLAAERIYAPVIWPMPTACAGRISASTEYVYGHILAFPCDQRYGEDDMRRICSVLRGIEL